MCRGKIKLVHEVDLVFDYIIPRELLTENLLSSLYIHFKKCEDYFRNSLRQTSKFTWNEVDNWCNFTVSSISEWWCICLFLKLQVWTMKLTEWMDACTSDRVACTIKVNIKETFMESEGFLQMFTWWMDCRQKIKYLFLANLVFSEGRTDFCYSGPTLGNSWTYGKKFWC